MNRRNEEKPETLVLYDSCVNHWLLDFSFLIHPPAKTARPQYQENEDQKNRRCGNYQRNR